MPFHDWRDQPIPLYLKNAPRKEIREYTTPDDGPDYRSGWILFFVLLAGTALWALWRIAS